MKLYFLRHAEAEDGPVDAERALTEKGRRDARRVGSYLEEIGTRFDLAFTSPLVRARQTAESVVEACPLRKKGRLEETDVLLNDGAENAFPRWLASLPEVDAVLLVGHEPSLSAHVRRLLGLRLEAALPLAKGAVARVDSDDRGTGTLKLLITPKQLP